MSHHRSFDPPGARDYPPVAELPDRACNGVDPAVFYPRHTSGNAAAIAICQQCPHRKPCLDWAIETGQNFGVWGATSADTRQAMIREAS
jgi:WhiB family redox-sensing transcriptional regulator